MSGVLTHLLTPYGLSCSSAMKTLGILVALVMSLASLPTWADELPSEKADALLEKVDAHLKERQDDEANALVKKQLGGEWCDSRVTGKDYQRALTWRSHEHWRDKDGEKETATSDSPSERRKVARRVGPAAFARAGVGAEVEAD